MGRMLGHSAGQWDLHKLSCFLSICKHIQAASSATTVDDSPRNKSKIDNSAYRYIGRSHDVGSSVGLTVDPPVTETLQSYNYTDVGYLMNATCILNRTSMWTISDIMHDTNDGASPNIWYAQDFFPNSNWTKIFANKLETSVFGGWNNSSQVTLGRTPSKTISIGSVKSDNVSEYCIAIAAGDGYSGLDKVQCNFFFQPTLFSVNVSTVENLTVVLPLGATTDSEPRGVLRSKIMAALGTISMVQTTLYDSTVGAAPENNVQDLLTRTTGKVGSSK